MKNRKFINIRHVGLLLCLVCLTACSSFRITPVWQDGLPPQEYFIDAFQADEANHQYQTQDDYLLWVGRFYNGLNLVPGWLDLTEQVLERLEVDQQEDVESRLFILGQRLASEWAKDNNVRKLNSRNANIWRDALIESLNQDDLDHYLTRVEQDVDDILADKLNQNEIYFERYYEDEFDF